MGRTVDPEAYSGNKLDKIITIDSIVSIHYFEFSRNIRFWGERHKAWEVVYVDKGQIEVVSNENTFKLRQGEMIFHKPGEFHNIITDGDVAPNVVVLSFMCTSPAMEIFQGKILNISRRDRDLLSGILEEATEAFNGPFDDPYTTRMEKRSAGKAGAEQMLLIRLEELLINLIRESGYISKHTELCPMARELAETSLVESVMLYLEEHISENITMDQLCVKFNIGKTILKTAFKEVTGHGVISYHARQKIEKAKRLIRENTYNYTQIADILGYSSIHYFSSAFKKATNMTPSEYAISVKAKMGG